MKIRVRQVLPIALAMALAGALAAQEDPPSRVARLSYISGSVSFEPSTVNDWAPASLNYPLTTGDNLYTDNGARAVLRVSRASIRLAPGTNFQMVNLSDQIAQMSINSGAVDVRVRNLSDSESWEVDTPNGAVTLLRSGEYRIDTDPGRNATMVTVRSGDALVTSNNQSFPVHARQTAYVDPNGQPNVTDMNPPDDFDQFGATRDRLEDAPPPPYVSQYVTGYEDLTAYGTWQSSPDYGNVWVPRVEAGWAPYHDGHWAWVGPWGWTWVDDSPWGFAPFHYGRWAYVNNYWGWVPGPVSVQPVYAPALVAFVGGGGFGVGIGVGGGLGAVGWFALGPREPYFPAYHVSDSYVRSINVSNTTITNITIINNQNNFRNVTYANQRVVGAVTAVPQNSFASGASVQRAAIRITPDQIRSVQVVAAAPVVPQRASVLAAGSRAGAPVARPPANIASRPVIAKIAPPPAPVRFEAQQQALQQNPGRPVAPQQLQSIRQASPAAAPARMQVRTVVPSQVHAVTPVPHAVPAAVNPATNNPQPGRPAVNTPAPNTFNRPANTPPPAAAPRPANTPPPAAAAPRPANTPPPAAAPRPQNVPPVQNRPAPPAENRPAPAPVQTRPAPPVERPAPAESRPAPPPVQTRPAPAENRPVPAEARPVPAETRPAPAPRPQNAPPPAVNRPAPPPPQQHPAAAPPKPAPKPKEEKPKDEKEKEKQ